MNDWITMMRTMMKMSGGRTTSRTKIRDAACSICVVASADDDDAVADPAACSLSPVPIGPQNEWDEAGVQWAMATSWPWRHHGHGDIMAMVVAVVVAAAVVMVMVNVVVPSLPPKY
jgi:hypothetical protein